MRVNEYLLGILHTEIIKVFGRPVKNASDCDALAAVIEANIKRRISSQTLRRIFGIIKHSGGASTFTLDTLSLFCGFRSYIDFEKNFTADELDLFFAGEDDGGKPYWDKSEELCSKILESPQHLISSHYRFMEYPLARTYFMEHHPMRDLLCTVYAQYFQVYLKYQTTSEAKLFAYSFLFLSAFLTSNDEFLEIFFHKVHETASGKDLFVIPAANKYGVELLYAYLKADEALYSKAWQEMLERRKHYIPMSERSVASFEYTVLEYLIFTDRTADMLFLVQNNTFQKYSDREFVPERRIRCHHEVWKILCAIVYTKSNNREMALSAAEKINPDNLGCGWSQYYTILYHQTLKQLGVPTDYDFDKVLSQNYLHKLTEIYKVNSEQVCER